MKTMHRAGWDDFFALSPEPSNARPEWAVDPRLDVLVIEDNASTRRALELSLGHLGHLVFSAPTLRDGWQLMRGLQIDVVVCDFWLPDGNGLELMARWPDGVRRVPSVAISGAPDEGLQARCLAAGFDAFLPKPLEVETLRRTIRNVARRAD